MEISSYRSHTLGVIVSFSLLQIATNNLSAEAVHKHVHSQSTEYAPVGIMGDHHLNEGEWMVSYRYMGMDMEDNLIGTDTVSPDFIVTTVPNRFFGAPGQPPTLRIVPLEMTMNMHMFGLMYAPSDAITLMGMINYVSKEMDHVTYMGPAGTNVLGGFTTKSSGLGDTYLGAIFRLIDTPTQMLHINFGVTAPTGDIKETDVVLTPTGMRPSVRLPYAMQLGSGTWDLKPGLTYQGSRDRFTWGAQYMGTFRLDDNNENYSWGDVHEITAWAAYSPRVWWGFSGRIAWQDMGKIDGIDPNIVGPVQTANPDFYGGDWFVGYLGLSFVGQSGWVRNQRLALEAGWPIDQDLNGPQMKQDFRITLGWEYPF